MYIGVVFLCLVTYSNQLNSLMIIYVCMLKYVTMQNNYTSYDLSSTSANKPPEL